MSSLFINDLDAGAGRMGAATQYTVNNQMVNATLMNIADNPTNVQLPGVYKVQMHSLHVWALFFKTSFMPGKRQSVLTDDHAKSSLLAVFIERQ